MIRKLFKFFFDNWYRPLLFFFISTLLFIWITGVASTTTIYYLGFVILYIGFAILLTSTIYELYKKSWRKFILSGLLFCFIFLTFYLIENLIAYHPDHYADNLKIPDNIQINIPLNNNETKNNSETTFHLYNAGQPGLYMYAVWTKRIERGKLYLKAFEITHNDPLSVDELLEKTLIEVYNPTDSIVKFITKDSEEGRPFTIYEGEWGKPYAAKFEVWFKPDIGGHEKKLFEKNYKIEGWQR